jgi:negative regulator of flagellin synthesis FlgM
MTDPISTYNRLGKSPDLSSRSGSAERKGERQPAGIDGGASGAGEGSGAASASPGGDQFILSEAAQQTMRTEAFDQAKVEAIKQALRNGQYPLDSRRIAESFYAIERLID